MNTLAAVYQMHDHIAYVKEHNIPGAIVETGCWKGGLGAYMAQFGRPTWLFDSFEGLPAMTEKDRDLALPKNLPLHTKTGYIAVAESRVHSISKKLGVEPHIIKGWFEDTLPQHKGDIGPIAVLRLDGDTYDSTLQALEILYNQVSEGGFVVIDDYDAFRGCREAVYDFFVSRKIAPRIMDYPYGKPYFRKEVDL